MSTSSVSVAGFLALLLAAFEEGLFWEEGMAVEQLECWGEKMNNETKVNLSVNCVKCVCVCERSDGLWKWYSIIIGIFLAHWCDY